MNLKRGMILLFQCCGQYPEPHTYIAARKLFLEYHEFVVLPKLSGIRPERTRTIQEIQAAFPFELPKLREGEPSRPVYPLVGDELVYWNLTAEARNLTRPYEEWAKQQPDGALLLSSQFDLCDWFAAEGAQSLFFALVKWGVRWKEAEACRAKGFGNLLDSYWSNNLELRYPPPLDFDVNIRK